MRECYLWQVKSSQLGGSCPFPGNIKGNDVSHPLHLMDDSIGVGHGLSVSCAWLPPMVNHSVNLSVYFFWKTKQNKTTTTKKTGCECGGGTLLFSKINAFLKAENLSLSCYLLTFHLVFCLQRDTMFPNFSKDCVGKLSTLTFLVLTT